jgi:putative ABC transport system permease protein
VDRALTLADQLRREFRLALRRLWATPVFTVFAVISLALGLGVTTAVYSTVAALVWNPTSIEDADRLAVVTRRVPGTRKGWLGAVSRSDFDDLRRQMRSVSAMAASSLVACALNDGIETSAFTARAVSGNFFALARLPLHLGRGIEDADDRSGADPVVVLSHAFWQSKAGGDRSILGRTVRIGGHPFIVIGVAGGRISTTRDLYGQYGLVGADGWIPLADRALATGLVAVPGDEPALTVIARMPAASALPAIATEVGGIGAALDQSMPLGDPANGSGGARTWSATSAAALVREQAGLGRAGDVVVLVVGLLLVIACTNLANLTLGRSRSRVHEFAVRRSLGASRGRLVREQCAESVVLAALGGVGALAVSTALLRYFTADFPLTNLQVIALRPKLSAPALEAAAVSLLASLAVIGVIPALHLTRATLRERLARADAGASPTRWQGRRRLIGAQVAISTALMLVAFASTRAATADARHDPGFDVPHLAIGFVRLQGPPEAAARTQGLIEALDAATEAQPGFESVALAAALPLGIGPALRQLARLSAMEEPSAFETAVVVPATPGIFRTLGVPILRGRGFDARDTRTTRPVIVTSERTARRVFGSADVVGRQMTYVGPSDTTPGIVEVIGVARDTDTVDLFDRRVGAVYVPLAQRDARAVILVGRTAGDPAPMARTFAGIVRRVNPDLAVEFASTGPMAMTPGSVLLRTAATLSAALSVLAVALAMLGLYGVLSHLVGSRTREIGLRLALGAEPGRVRWMIVGEGLRPVVWGVGVGLVVAIGARLVLRAIAAGRNISAIDPLAVGVVAAALIIAGAFACYLPARRASRVAPNVALRDL